MPCADFRAVGANVAERGVRLIRKKGRRRITAFVFPDNRIEIRAPWNASDAAVAAFVRAAEPWIRRKIEKNRRRPKVNPLAGVHGEKIPWMGREIELHVRPGNKRSVLSETALVVHASTDAAARKKLAGFYSKKAETVFADSIARLAPLVGRTPSRFSVRGMKSRWGSCSHKGSLSLNWKILAAPAHVIDYLVVHELCHLVHPNHSKSFWKEVERVFPDYQAAEKYLKENGPAILTRFG